jgi:hypothetical protein
VRHAEDDMEVSCGQDFLFAGSQPTLARLCLALGAMPVTAGVIGNGLMTAPGTTVQVAAERRRAALLDGVENP